ncbi:tail fiber domain-containing protein [bacterium]|nr:tail fiber domain-containing protein [bacterium]
MISGDVRASGEIVAGYSDRRLKNVKGPIDNPIRRINKLNGYFYSPNKLAKNMIGDISGRKIGLIAQELEQALPEVVRGAPFDINKHGHSKSGKKYLTVDYARVVPLLVEALKEQKNQINDLKSRIGKLNGN